MPNYNSQVTTGTPMTALYPGDPDFNFFNAETPVNGQKSVAVSLAMPYGEGGQNQCVVTSSFPAGAPGAVSWKLQGAMDDVDAQYADISGAAGTSVNGESVAFSTNFTFIRAVEVTQPSNGKTHTLALRKIS